jgi:hypothetical protein
MRRVELFAATVATLVVVADSSVGYSLNGRGALTCESWTAARRNSSRPEAGLNEQWVVGFLSGIGFMALGELDPLRGVDGQFVYDWVDGYCRNNPAETIADAAGRFIQQHPR